MTAPKAPVRDVRCALLAKTTRLLGLLSFLSLYSLSVLSTVDDTSILLNRTITVVPLIQAQLRASYFFIFMPIALTLMCHYFHFHFALLTVPSKSGFSIEADAKSTEVDYILHDLVLSQVRRDKSLKGAETFPVNYASSSLSYLAIWGLAPVTVALTWLRYLPRHSLSTSYFHIFTLCAIIAVPSFIHQSRRSWRSLSPPFLATSLAGAAATVVTHALGQGVPKVCFDTGLHDQNYPFFSYAVVKNDCERKLGKAERRVIADWLYAGLPAGADLVGANLSSKTSSADAPIGPIVTAGLDLTNLNATGLSLYNCIATRSNLTGATLRGSDLRETNFKFSTLFMTDLRESDLHGTSFIRTTQRYVDFDHAKHAGSWYRGATVRDSRITYSSLAQAQLECATFERVDFSHTDFSEAELSNTRFIDCQFPAATNLTQAALSAACGERSVFDAATTLLLRPCPRDWEQQCQQDVAQ